MGRKQINDMDRIRTLSIGVKYRYHEAFEDMAFSLGLSNHEFGEALIKALLSGLSREEILGLIKPHVRFHHSKKRHGDRRARSLWEE